jgi:hypothetical protein
VTTLKLSRANGSRECYYAITESFAPALSLGMLSPSLRVVSKSIRSQTDGDGERPRPLARCHLACCRAVRKNDEMSARSVKNRVAQGYQFASWFDIRPLRVERIDRRRPAKARDSTTISCLRPMIVVLRFGLTPWGSWSVGCARGTSLLPAPGEDQN